MSRLPSLGPRGEGWVLLQLVLLVAVALSGVISGNAFGGGLGGITTLAGLGLMFGGAALLGRGLMDLGQNLTPMPRPRDDAQLVDTGIYALVRHPLYGGLVVTAFGWALVSSSLVTLVLALVLGGFFDLKSRREEVWLKERYPDYEAYMARTQRLIPKIY